MPRTLFAAGRIPARSSVPFAVGSNVPGYLPDAEPHMVKTWEEAKQVLIADLLFEADYGPDDEDTASYTRAADDVAAWTTPTGRVNEISVCGRVYWIETTR
jgi:hypothetical protein